MSHSTAKEIPVCTEVLIISHLLAQQHLVIFTQSIEIALFFVVFFPLVKYTKLLSCFDRLLALDHACARDASIYKTADCLIFYRPACTVWCDLDFLPVFLSTYFCSFCKSSCPPQIIVSHTDKESIEMFKGRV